MEGIERALNISRPSEGEINRKIAEFQSIKKRDSLKEYERILSLFRQYMKGKGDNPGRRRYLGWAREDFETVLKGLDGEELELPNEFNNIKETLDKTKHDENIQGNQLKRYIQQLKEKGNKLFEAVRRLKDK